MSQRSKNQRDKLSLSKVHGEVKGMSVKVSLYHDVYDSSGHDDDFHNVLSFQIFLRLLGSEGGFADGVGRGIGREVEGEASFSIEGDGEGDAVFFQMAFIKNGPLGVADGGGVSKFLPKFFSHMGREGSEKNHEFFQHLARNALLLSQFSGGNHEGGNGGVVGERFDVLSHFFDEFVERLEVFFRCGFLLDCPLAVFVEEEVLTLSQEAETTVNAVGIPRFALVDGSEEHFIEAERVCAIGFNNVVGIYDVIH